MGIDSAGVGPDSIEVLVMRLVSPPHNQHFDGLARTIGPWTSS